MDYMTLDLSPAERWQRVLEIEAKEERGERVWYYLGLWSLDGEHSYHSNQGDELPAHQVRGVMFLLAREGGILFERLEDLPKPYLIELERQAIKLIDREIDALLAASKS